ncbi:MAG: hypothetical protein KQI62_00215 [Deltaproteobacteria bacterium]|nr:hypothetical protein [Deltaproteobacteria bacterium]
MNEEWTPEKIKEAKRLAAGPLGRELTKFPLRFAAAVTMGERPKLKHKAYINNGTAVLVKLDKRPIAITCSHIMEKYREKLEQDSNTVFQIGQAVINPQERLVDENRNIDLATIDMSGIEAHHVCMQTNLELNYYEPFSWPPAPVKPGDFVCVGGYPGAMRKQNTSDSLVFESFSAAGVQVPSVNDEYFMIQFEREFWVKNFGSDDYLTFNQLGGMSGCPVFIERSHGGIMNFDMVGIASEYQEEYDLMRARHANLINWDGSIADLDRP